MRCCGRTAEPRANRMPWSVGTLGVPAPGAELQRILLLPAAKCLPITVPAEQPVSIALAVGSAVLGGRGAIRVHGGGFGGTVQAFVPAVLLSQFQEGMESVLGKGCCHVLRIRSVGGMTVLI
ncbi:MAG: hypothetical protein ACLT3Y_00535 [Ruminococcus callidus]